MVVANPNPLASPAAASTVAGGTRFGIGMAAVRGITNQFKNNIWPFLLIAMIIDGVSGQILQNIGFLVSVIFPFASVVGDRFIVWGSALSLRAFGGLNTSIFINYIWGPDWYEALHFNIFFLLSLSALFIKKFGKKFHINAWGLLLFLAWVASEVLIFRDWLWIRDGFQAMMLVWLFWHLSFDDMESKELLLTIFLFWVFYNLWMFGVIQNGMAFIHFTFFIIFYFVFGMGKKYADSRLKIKSWIGFMMLVDFFLPGLFQIWYPNFFLEFLSTLDS